MNYYFPYIATIFAALAAGMEIAKLHTGEGRPWVFSLMICLIFLNMYLLRRVLGQSPE